MPGKEGKQQKNYVELTNDMVLERAKEDLNKLKQSFEKIKNNPRETIKKTDKLNKINNLIQESKLDQADKEQFIKALDDLKLSIKNINNENINTENLKNKFDKITNLLDSLIHKELDNLKNDVQNPRTSNRNEGDQRPPIRPKEVEEGLEKSSEKIPKLIADAKHDKNWFIREVIAKLLERAYS